jgi:hypothetical protein
MYAFVAAWLILVTVGIVWWARVGAHWHRTFPQLSAQALRVRG